MTDGQDALRPSIMLGAHSQYRAVYTGVARQLRQTGCDVHLYVALPEQAGFYEGRDPDLYSRVTIANRLYEACAEAVADEAAVIARAKENEARLGASYNSILLTDRHLGRGFALGGFRHPRSRISRETSYVQAVHAVNETIAFWEREIDRTGARLILNCGKIAALVARARGIAYRRLSASRYKNYHYWGIDEYSTNPALGPAFDATEDAEAGGVEAPYATHLQMRGFFKSRLTLHGVLRDIGTTLARRLYWRLRGYEKAKGYLVADELGYLWRRYADMKAIARRSVTLEQLAGRRFIYYPLHTEPETALQTFSPEYFFQLSSIAALARDAPAGVLVAVKETAAAVGRRPRDFYDQIAEFKNVVFIDPNELGLKAAAQCDVVATITGTGGLEGAAMGRPVVTFGLHNSYNFLPHVRVMRDPEDLKPALDWALGPAFDAAAADRDGRRFLRALASVSFDLGDFSLRAPDAIDPAAVEAAVENLLAGAPDLRVSEAA
ncbi:MAG: capsular biosynthesis protein [Alphaproteobacteria bacterium]|nr:capsular biosynthesis protein [Alphaproteobacteria bacterium]